MNFEDAQAQVREYSPILARESPPEYTMEIAESIDKAEGAGFKSGFIAGILAVGLGYALYHGYKDESWKTLLKRQTGDGR